MPRGGICILKKNLITLNEFEGASLLRQSGIPVIDGIPARTEEEAAAAAEKLGFPVALKICSEAVVHKTERGGVALNIQDTAALDGAVREMKNKFADIPFAVLVQKMAPSGAELILGCRRDPVFGPIVLAGIGGIFTEILRDTVIDLAPVDEKAALAMLRRLKGAPLLEGYRSREPLDIAAAAKALSALSCLAAERADLLEIDVNPFIVYPRGAVAVDALVRLDAGPAAVPRKRTSPATVAPFFQPSSMAVIGASRSPGKGGNIILRNLQKAGYRGALYPINPTVKEILGLPSYARVSDVPKPVETAMVVIPKTAVPEALADCAAKGVTNIILSTGGYSDTGEEGAKEQKIIIDMARKAGIRVMGPNSIGTINPSAGMSTSIVGLDPIRPGGVSIIG